MNKLQRRREEQSPTFRSHCVQCPQ